MSTAGDVDGDGYGDILVGSPAAGTLSQGYAYLVFGGAELPASFDLKSGLSGTDGVVFKGAFTGETVVCACEVSLFVFVCLRFVIEMSAKLLCGV